MPYAWFLYVIIAWNPTPPLPMEEQKTIVFGFDHASDCTGVALQMAEQMKGFLIPPPFRFKELKCFSCKELYGDKCKPSTPMPKGRKG